MESVPVTLTRLKLAADAAVSELSLSSPVMVSFHVIISVGKYV